MVNFGGGIWGLIYCGGGDRDDIVEELYLN